ncbi:MAG: hypothetical protein Q8N51_11030 [Gammaproteobacteria bacterium]|nr:hypothetical protein [Gammaproteobacteria bacterium]
MASRFFPPLALLALVAGAANAAQPTVTISYSPGLDKVCSFFRGPAIEDAWRAELELRLPEFEQLWATRGPRMIAAAEAVTGKAFRPDEVTARLTLCNVPSQSIIGVSVNMRYALNAFTPSPVPMQYKSDTLFHELLHGYLDTYPVKDSGLLEQFASEPLRVRNHLHLLALEKAVFLRLNEPEALNIVVRHDSELPNGSYKRAWEIVNATDDEYLKYVAEIRR